jgi:MFS superfamily sulfate permease-like transporter
MPRLPILTSLRGYRPEWLRYDIMSGLSIGRGRTAECDRLPGPCRAAPEVGLYSSILAALGYRPARLVAAAHYGTGCGHDHDAGAVFVSLGLTSPDDASLVSARDRRDCRGALLRGEHPAARLLSPISCPRPILTGFMAGISLSILVGQIGRFTGVKIESDGNLAASHRARREGPADSLAVAGVGGRHCSSCSACLGAWLPAIPGPLVIVARRHRAVGGF